MCMCVRFSLLKQSSRMPHFSLTDKCKCLCCYINIMEWRRPIGEEDFHDEEDHRQPSLDQPEMHSDEAVERRSRYRRPTDRLTDDKYVQTSFRLLVNEKKRI